MPQTGIRRFLGRRKLAPCSQQLAWILLIGRHPRQPAPPEPGPPFEGPMMKRTTLIYLAILAAAFAGNAHAIFKCTTAKGVVYQDRPCREGNESDVQIVVPTGEVFKKPTAAPEDVTQPGANPSESRPAAPRAGRTAADDAVSVTRSTDRRSNETNAPAGESSPKKDTPTSVPNAGNGLATEQARNTEPAAKYYTNDGFGNGTDTPGRLTCESATGEKRVFYLSNGKLMSI